MCTLSIHHELTVVFAKRKAIPEIYTIHLIRVEQALKCDFFFTYITGSTHILLAFIFGDVDFQGL